MSWTIDQLKEDLLVFEDELVAAGLTASSVVTYVERSETFVRWLEGTYVSRGPNR